MIYALLGLLVIWLIYRTQARRESAPSHEVLTREQAREILGVDEGASKEDISEAYRSLMKALHPDAGGSEHLTKLVAEAKRLLDDDFS